MKPCTFVIKRWRSVGGTYHYIWCLEPGRLVNGVGRCADHWPKVVS